VGDLFLGRTVRSDGALEFDALGEAEEVGCSGLGDANGSRAGTQLVEVAEDVTEDFERRQSAGGGVLVYEEFVEVEGVDAGGQVLKLGVDFEADEVADDEEWRIVEGFVILVELLVCLL
jgi:hypothetical protein